MDPRGYNRYEEYRGGYQNYNDGYMSDSRYGPMYGRQMPMSGHGGHMPMYNPAPTFSPYGGNMGQMGMMGKLVLLLNEPRHEKTGFCLCENKGADQLRSNCEAYQRLCFHYTGNLIPSLLTLKTSRF